VGTRHKGSTHERAVLDAYIKLTRAFEALTRRLKPVLRKERLSSPQFSVLDALYHLGPLCPRDLGAKIHRSNSNVTSVVDYLEKRGWAKRDKDPKDRRKVRVDLTESGRSLIARVFPAYARRVLGEFQILSPEEHGQLSRLCAKLGLQDPNR
jgi:MarR family 2-MHQ and catechol resistance regulon transcriptional repressor